MPEEDRAARLGLRPTRKQYAVDVRGLEPLRGPERKIVYHGVNKSGSLTLTNVLLEGYWHHRRANEFFTLYRGIPKSFRMMQRLIELSTDHSFFGGHYLYNAYRSEPGEVLFTTQLRNPLPRARSTYTWLANLDKIGGKSFEDWLVGSRNHSQVRQFVADFTPEGTKSISGMPMDEMTGLAIANLERDLEWVGIAEYFEETAFTFAALCGLPTVASWAKDDRNAGRPLVDTWDAADVSLVREVLSHDFELYEWGLARFRTQLASLEFGPDLERYRADCLGEYKDRVHPDGTPITSSDVASLCRISSPEDVAPPRRKLFGRG